MKQLFIGTLLVASAVFAADRYEAENATLLSASQYDAEAPSSYNAVVKSNAAGSGGKYVSMNGGGLQFIVTVPTEGYYTLTGRYSQSYDESGKQQSLLVNDVALGSISFSYTGATLSFAGAELAAKVKLAHGSNTIEIARSWGWIDLDYIEVAPYTASPFTIAPTLVTPAASANAKLLYGFLLDYFQSKTVSGVMTNEVLLGNDPRSFDDLVEVSWIQEASGKQPALLGLDFIHGTGKSSVTDVNPNSWHAAYNASTLALAKEVWGKGGIPAYNWHWKDPTNKVESFYTTGIGSAFDFAKAFTDATYATWNTTSSEYIAIVRDIDVVAGYLKTLADAGVPILWRPLHEASGGWFWWGTKGPVACKQLWKLMFDRLVNIHKLDNLVWVWTSDDAASATDWYPGDEYVDIVGRDFYYYPRKANHASLASSFEAIKNITNGKKIVSLSECGSVPHPDSMAADGATWSYFMPWYGDYVIDTMQTKLDNGTYALYKDNTKEFWKTLMTHSFVISLDEMPGWDKYVVPVSPVVSGLADGWTLDYTSGRLQVRVPRNASADISVFDLRGSRVLRLHSGPLSAGTHEYGLTNLSRGAYLVRASQAGVQATRTIVVE